MTGRESARWRGLQALPSEEAIRGAQASLQSFHISKSWRNSQALDVVPTQAAPWVWAVPGDLGLRAQAEENERRLLAGVLLVP